jgi:hypothetical protein
VHNLRVYSCFQPTFKQGIIVAYCPCLLELDASAVESQGAVAQAPTTTSPRIGQWQCGHVKIWNLPRSRTHTRRKPLVRR